MSSYRYQRTTAEGRSATIDVVPIGGALSGNVCTVRHGIRMAGPPSVGDDRSTVHFPVMDAGTMEHCSTIQGRILKSPGVAEVPAVLTCPVAPPLWRAVG